MISEIDVCKRVRLLLLVYEGTPGRKTLRPFPVDRHTVNPQLPEAIIARDAERVAGPVQSQIVASPSNSETVHRTSGPSLPRSADPHPTLYAVLLVVYEAMIVVTSSR